MKISEFKREQILRLCELAPEVSQYIVELLNSFDNLKIELEDRERIIEQMIVENERLEEELKESKIDSSLIH